MVTFRGTIWRSSSPNSCRLRRLRNVQRTRNKSEASASYPKHPRYRVPLEVRKCVRLGLGDVQPEAVKRLPRDGDVETFGGGPRFREPLEGDRSLFIERRDAASAGFRVRRELQPT